jgi:hypothetical protein
MSTDTPDPDPLGLDPFSLSLGKRALASPFWKWMPGMLVAGDTERWPCRVVEEVQEFKMCAVAMGIAGRGHFDREALEEDDQEVPDLNDPATFGCLVHLVEKAWNSPFLYLAVEWNTLRNLPVAYHTMVGDRRVGSGRTKAEALVIALEAAANSRTKENV